METHTSGIQCSGTIIVNNRENTPTACNVPSNQWQSTIPAIRPLSGVTLEIITSGIPCSGASWNNYGGNTCSGFVKNTNQPESMPRSTYCEITNGTSIPSDQSSKFYSSSHIETIGFTPQNSTPTYLHSPSQIPQNYIPQYISTYPIPSELFDFTSLIPIMKMSGHQFEAFIQWVFEQLGYTVTRMKKTHDKGGDILLERFGERIIIQARHGKEHTGIGALQAVIFAKKIYGATKARVISISPFTAEAIRDAPKAEIELWDLEQLLTELRNQCIYYPIE